MSCRHISVLLRKNLINWYRSPIGSLIEILIPAYVCYVLWGLTENLIPWTSGGNLGSGYRFPSFPTAKLQNDTWVQSFGSTMRSSHAWENFTTYTKETPTVEWNIETPFWYYPRTCMNAGIDKDWTRYGSVLAPVIAYVDRDNEVTQDIIDQLELQLASMAQIPDFLNATSQPWVTDLFGISTTYAAALGKMFFLDSEANFTSTVNISISDFHLAPFESQEAIEAYIAHPDYGNVASRPGICWAFDIDQKGDRDFEASLLLMDREGPAKAFYQLNDPQWQMHKTDLDSHSLTISMRGPYYFFSNMLANTLLRRFTVSDAEIVAILLPTHNDVVPNIRGSQNLYEISHVYLLIAWLPFLLRTGYMVLEEKESRVKETMRMMGMSLTSYWLSWFIYFTVVNTLLSSLVSVCIWQLVLTTTPFYMTFIYIWAHGQYLFAIILCAQAFFDSPKSGSLFMGLYYFLSVAVTFMFYEKQYLTARLIASALCPSVNLAFLQQANIYFYCHAFLGLTMENWNIEYMGVAPRTHYELMGISVVAFYILGILCEMLVPQTYGRAYDLCGCCRKRSGVDLKDALDPDFETKHVDRAFYEPVAPEIARKAAQDKVLIVEGLTMQYPDGTKAVNGINLKMYSDQIFCLLGHNGAGKTSTISMLTGLFKPTAGAGRIYGVDLFQSMNEVRKILGICPQHDVLFSALTPRQHLEFFYDMKGADPSSTARQKDIETLIVDVGLEEKIDSRAGSLSGGNKRKLSIAIALVGDSNFVILDEPTAGLDVSARRHLWSMLKRRKKNRIILMSTHYMEEADMLSDRVGVMVGGKVTCLGTSNFLKNTFGVGYTFTAVKTDTAPNTMLLPYLRDRLGPKIYLQNEVQSTLTLKIAEEYSSKFPDLFHDFEHDLESLSIRNFGISISTLEEVFIKIGSCQNPSVAISNKGNPSKSDESIDDAQIDTRPLLDLEQQEFSMQKDSDQLDTSFCTNLSAITQRRLQIYRRKPSVLCAEMIMPLIAITVVALASLSVGQQESQTVLVTAEAMPENTPVVMNPWPVTDNETSLEGLVASFPKRLKFVNITEAPTGLNVTAWNSTGFWNTSIPTPADPYNETEYFADTRTRQENSTWINSDLASSLHHEERLVAFARECTEPPFSYGGYLVYDYNETSNHYKFDAIVNLTQTGAPYTYPQLMYEAILKAAANVTLNLSLNPYPVLVKELAFQNTKSDPLILSFGLGGLFALVMASVVNQLVTERISGLKHLQILSGMQLTTYWCAQVLVDTIKMWLVIAVCIGVLEGVGFHLPVTYLIMVLSPVCLLPFTYSLSFAFQTESVAQMVTVSVIFFMLALLSQQAFGDRIDYFQEGTEVAGDLNNLWYHIFPPYAIGSVVFFELVGTYLNDLRNIRDTAGVDINPDLWQLENAYLSIISVFANGLVWTLVLIAIESDCNCKWGRGSSIKIETDHDDCGVDRDVAQERTRVQEKQDDDAVLVKDLTREFTTTAACCSSYTFNAVQNLSFGVAIGECFALLGVNGAGKSTTFKCLAKSEVPTSGDIQINGFDLRSEFEQARKLIGYCPQHNLLFDPLTIQEHVQYYAKLKGIPARIREEVCEQVIQKLGLDSQRHKEAGTLSGGNKRKLCVAIALIGNPPIILLDEPSAGMDPGTRQFMWNLCASITRQKSSAIVLTTHSMEEAEALATKMGIMVKGGKFKCFGTPQYIRSKYGSGFVIELKIVQLRQADLEEAATAFLTNQKVDRTKLRHLSTDLIKELQNRKQKFNQDDFYRSVHGQTNIYGAMQSLIQKLEKPIVVLEQFGNYVRLQVDAQDCSVGKIFAIVESIKAEWSVAEYSVSQTTLEQIFQEFAQQGQEEEKEEGVTFEVREGLLTEQL